jgi:hypothetical protein
MSLKDGSRTPARLRLAALVIAAPLSVAATSVVVEAAPVQPAAVTQTSAAPAGGSALVVDRGRGRGDRRGRDRDRCGLLVALLFGCR